MSCKKNTSQENHKYTNDLIHETSPYLLQHAHNPVNWKAWNPETLALAKKENKLIIISVGYSACHWCHVMEEESFENDSVAKIMNDNFISIKVDREERPDIDQIYMNAVQLISGSGGWPLNCIALPDGRPIFGGTYFPKEDWKKILLQVNDFYKKDPAKAAEYATKLLGGIKESEQIKFNTAQAEFKSDEVTQALTEWNKHIDPNKGGLMGAPKFPMPKALHFLLRYAHQNKDAQWRNYVETTLQALANGGIYDQVGGGFSRYSVDEDWHIPHFEKMLYDNAQLVSLYADAYLATKNPTYKQIIEETLTFVDRELTNDNGAFYSSLDADSKNKNNKLEEGAFYSWEITELKAVLKTDFDLFKDYYNINKTGFWEHNQYVLIKTQSDVAFAKSHSVSPVALASKVKKWKQTLLKVRSKRNRPHLDDKTLTSWNAMMLKGYVQAYKALKKPHYLEVAIKNAQFILKNQTQKDGSLYHNYKEGKSTIDGFSEDYAAVIDAYISLYQVTLDEKWLRQANALTKYSLANFFDTKTHMFFFTSKNAKNLITKKMEIQDNVIPGSNSTMAKNLFQLGHYFSEANYSKIAKQMLNNVKKDAIAFPVEYYNWLDLMLNYTDTYYEVAVSGPEAVQKIKALQSYYLPNVLFAGATTESKIPLLESRFMPNQTDIYICVEGACKLPESDVAKAVSKMR
ncbi:thioredoxin domain-containing protein [Flavobacterium sp. NG2]|uniref:thioredoxin domain-containing protein n=1 Tax=Flavobacterium sp. NG2 TaxID=3097547 RepID=UPI002A7F5FCF|nr:thioredoxin domain-containing protein [Flavobacterium sp. NG2]WPR73030.1 thioredoxin domain-containing protein [Flavobacterium sp. NG2]